MGGRGAGLSLSTKPWPIDLGARGEAHATYTYYTQGTRLIEGRRLLFLLLVVLVAPHVARLARARLARHGCSRPAYSAACLLAAVMVCRLRRSRSVVRAISSVNSPRKERGRALTQWGVNPAPARTQSIAIRAPIRRGGVPLAPTRKPGASANSRGVRASLLVSASRRASSEAEADDERKAEEQVRGDGSSAVVD